MRTRIILIILMSLFIIEDLAAQKKNITFSIQVEDIEENPILGATASVDKQGFTVKKANSNGVIHLNFLNENEKILVKIRAKGYQPKNEEITVSSKSSENSKTITLIRAPKLDEKIIHGLIMDKKENRIGKIKIILLTSGVYKESISNSSGQYEIRFSTKNLNNEEIKTLNLEIKSSKCTIIESIPIFQSKSYKNDIKLPCRIKKKTGIVGKLSNKLGKESLILAGSAIALKLTSLGLHSTIDDSKGEDMQTYNTSNILHQSSIVLGGLSLVFGGIHFGKSKKINQNKSSQKMATLSPSVTVQHIPFEQERITAGMVIRF